MIALTRDVNTPQFVPDYLAGSLLKVDFALLREKGVRYVAFDADSTLVPYGGTELSAETEQFLKTQRKLFDGWCIASNRVTRNLQPMADSMNAGIVQATLFNRKPQRRYFEQIIRHFNAKPSEIAMIGDKLAADIYGANRMGMVAVWVENIGPDSIVDRLIHLRRLEKLLLRHYRK